MMNFEDSPVARKRVLVTGGAGFIGSHLCDRLIDLGCDVSIADNLGTEQRLQQLKAAGQNVNVFFGDLGDLLRRNRLQVSNFDYVFHLAGNSSVPPSVENPINDFHANAENTVLLLDALRRCNSEAVIVNVSSGLVYGNPESLPVTETHLTVPTSPYGASKLTGERYTSVYAQIYGLRSCSVRFFAIYGPGQRKQVIYDLFKKLIANPDRLEVIGDGTQLRDFLYVDDAVNGLLCAASNSKLNGDVYNAASGSSVTIDQLLHAIAAEMGVNPEIVYSGQVRPGDTQGWTVDISKIQRELKFQPQVELHEGLRNIWQWFKSAESAKLAAHSQ